MITKQIIENGIYGVAIGDALGVPYEFFKRDEIAEKPCVDMIGYGTYYKPAGTFSDDTSMTLAGLYGLSSANSDADYTAVMECFRTWREEGRFSVDGVFDVGRTCSAAILKYKRGFAPMECGGCDEFDNGNGSLMRILPAIFYSLARYNYIDSEFIGEMSALTHGHIISKTACQIYANVAKAILDGVDKASLLSGLKTYGQTVFSRLKSADFYKISESEIRSSGYVVDTLEAALWCFCNTNSYSDCVLKAVNLGGDTDTTAAVAGGLAGLYYGKEAIPKKWLKTLRGKEIIDECIEKFCNHVK